MVSVSGAEPLVIHNDDDDNDDDDCSNTILRYIMGCSFADFLCCQDTVTRLVAVKPTLRCFDARKTYDVVIQSTKMPVFV